METLDVIFRAERSGEVTAVFPDSPADYHGRQMTIYAHVGQHGGAGFDWYRNTRAAKPDEYGDLLAELTAIYGRGDEPVALRVVCRRTAAHRREFEAAVRRYRAGVAGESLFVQGRIGESV